MPDNEKPTNPKDAIGIKKVAMSTVPAPFMMGVGAAMTEGALKYGRHNYREAGVRSSVYYDALMRHMTAWWEGEDIDQESGLSHLLKAAACLAVVYDSLSYGNLNDDRPPKHADGWQQSFNSIAEQLMARYPVPKPAHVAVKQISALEALQSIADQVPVTTDPVPQRHGIYEEPEVYHGILPPPGTPGVARQMTAADARRLGL